MPSVQIAFASFTAVGMMIYVTVIRPYDSILSTILGIINECLLVAMILTTFRFLDPIISPNLSSSLGTMFIGIIVGTIAVNWIGIVIYGLSIGLSRYLHNRKYKKLLLKAQNLKSLRKPPKPSKSSKPLKPEPALVVEDI